MTAMWYSLPVLACLTLQPCPSEPDRSSLTPTVDSDAQPLVSHLHHVLSSPIARLLPPPGSFEPDRLSLTPTVSVRAQPFVSHLHHVVSSTIARLRSNHVHLSATARLPPSSDPFEPDCSSPTQPCLFERNRSSPASAGPGRFSPTQPCQLERNCSCPILH